MSKGVQSGLTGWMTVVDKDCDIGHDCGLGSVLLSSAFNNRCELRFVLNAIWSDFRLV